MKPLQEITEVLRTTPANQITGSYVRFDDFGKTCGYCALGALMCSKDPIINSKQFYETYTTTAVLDLYQMLKFSFRINDVEVLEMGNDEVFSIESMIIIANDTYHLSFKEIADLLEATFPEGY